MCGVEEMHLQFLLRSFDLIQLQELFTLKYPFFHIENGNWCQKLIELSNKTIIDVRVLAPGVCHHGFLLCDPKVREKSFRPIKLPLNVQNCLFSVQHSHWMESQIIPIWLARLPLVTGLA